MGEDKHITIYAALILSMHILFFRLFFTQCMNFHTLGVCNPRSYSPELDLIKDDMEMNLRSQSLFVVTILCSHAGNFERNCHFGQMEVDGIMQEIKQHANCIPTFSGHITVIVFDPATRSHTNIKLIHQGRILCR